MSLGQTSNRLFLKVWQWWPLRHFERQQLFHLNTGIVIKQGFSVFRWWLFRGVVAWERVGTAFPYLFWSIPFCTSNVTWRFRFLISISACSALEQHKWINVKLQYLVYSTAARLCNYCLWHPQWYLRALRFVWLFAFIVTLPSSSQRSN